jgi:hypothetical protein
MFFELRSLEYETVLYDREPSFLHDGSVPFDAVTPFSWFAPRFM